MSRPRWRCLQRVMRRSMSVYGRYRHESQRTVLHTRPRVHLELARIDRSAQTGVILARVLAVCVALWSGHRLSTLPCKAYGGQRARTLGLSMCSVGR